MVRSKQEKCQYTLARRKMMNTGLKRRLILDFQRRNSITSGEFALKNPAINR